MTIDIAKLSAFDIPRGRQELTPAAVAAYALSIGIGQEPLDRRQLEFVDPVPTMQVMPTIALVLAHPGFWMAHPDSGVDPSGVLHADQKLEILAPLPCTGMVTSRSTIVGIVDKGAGKAALVRTETLVEAEGTGAIARLLRTTFHRGGGGFGGANAPFPPRPPMPCDLPLHSVDLAIRPEQALLYRLNGDLNPLHSDPDSACASGFARPILHGLCTMGMACHALLRTLADYRADRLRTMALRFSGVVFPGETLRVEIWPDGRFQARAVERDAVVIDDGEAVIATVPGGANEAANITLPLESS